MTAPLRSLCTTAVPDLIQFNIIQLQKYCINIVILNGMIYCNDFKQIILLQKNLIYWREREGQAIIYTTCRHADVHYLLPRPNQVIILGKPLAVLSLRLFSTLCRNSWSPTENRFPGRYKVLKITTFICIIGQLSPNQ